MFIILKQTNESSSCNQIVSNDEVVNVFYCKDATLVRNWVRDYIEKDISSYSYAPNTKDTKHVTYELNDGEHNYQLLKKYKRIHPGYVYNSSERITEIIYSITILEFDSNKIVSNLEAPQMWRNINNEVNNRVLKQLDKDSLLQVVNTIRETVDQKDSWSKTEFTALIGETLSNFKKELYSTISKRLKRFGKRQSLYKKNPYTPSYVPKDFNTPRTPCQLEAIKAAINKKND